LIDKIIDNLVEFFEPALAEQIADVSASKEGRFDPGGDCLKMLQCRKGLRIAVREDA
jgi:hypothetical protein